MEYVLVIEYESRGEVTCQIKGLPLTHLIRLEGYFNNLNIMCKRIQDEIFEVDVEGVKLLNVLGSSTYSASTTTEDIEWSEHIDTDIEWIEFTDFEEDESEIQGDVKKRVDMIEEKIFKEIARMDRESKELSDDQSLKDIRKKIEMINMFNKKEDILNETETKEKQKDMKNKTDTREKRKQGIQNKTKTKEKNQEEYSLKEEDNLDEEQMNIHQERAEKKEIRWNEGDKILSRYYSRKWKYYVSIIKNINRYENIYSVTYHKQIRSKDHIKFVIPKRSDEDKYLPENATVKSIELLPISEYPDEYVLMNDEDNIYFD
ncbi:unnamed protein product [Parnassius mnemosyne]|uniref:Uncharacterized protein n=1 Tax=Parnassius mnemosyne TaxID=213953 RepID=A0AAV1KVV8_9NEOP